MAEGSEEATVPHPELYSIQLQVTIYQRTVLALKADDTY